VVEVKRQRPIITARAGGMLRVYIFYDGRYGRAGLRDPVVDSGKSN